MVTIKRIDRSILVLAIVTLVSRLPFLGAGYGTDPDAWRAANDAKFIASSGTYVWSRPPGLPVHEIISALLYKGGPWILNGTTALFSVVAVVFFALSLRRMNIRNYFPAGLMFAFVPIVYISSTVLMDYMWALGFVMLSLYMILGNRVVWAGVFMGLAIGCRLTSGAMVLPFLIMLNQSRPDLLWRQNAYRLGRFLLATGVTTIVAFSPVLIKYGVGFFTFYDAASPPITKAVHKASFEIWGIMGTFLLVTIITGAAILPKIFCVQGSGGFSSWRQYIRPSIIVIVLYTVAFLRLPNEAGYLIPVIPFVILLLAGSLRRWVVTVACVSMIITSYVDMTCATCYRSWQNGPFLADYISRSRGIKFVNSILAESKHLPNKSAIVVAWWEPHLRLMKGQDLSDSIAYIYCLDSVRLREWVTKGYTIYHLPSVEEYNKTYYEIDLTQVGPTLNITY